MGFRRGLGHISVTNTATATASGTAMTRAIRDETSVPYRKGTAPKSPETGSHWLPTKNFSPKACHARDDRCMSSETISPTIPSTHNAASSISPRKPLSKVKTVRYHAGALRAVVTSEILGESGVPIDSGWLESAPLPRLGFGIEKRLSGTAPMHFRSRYLTHSGLVDLEPTYK